MSNKSIATIATMGIDIGKNWRLPPDSCRPRPMAIRPGWATSGRSRNRDITLPYRDSSNVHPGGSQDG